MSKTITIFLLILLITSTNKINATASQFPLEKDDKVRITYSSNDTTNGVQNNNTLIEGIFGGLENNHMLIYNLWDVRIDKAVKKDSTVVEYPRCGAKYDTLLQKITGIDNQGQVNDLSLEEIDYVDVTLTIKNKLVSTSIYANRIHNRFRLVNNYPEYRSIPIDSISMIKKYSKGNSSMIMFGILAGGAMGYLYGSGFEEDDKPSGEFLDLSPRFSKETKIMFDTILGAAIGGSFGYLIGKANWEYIPINKVKVTISSINTSAVGIKLSLKF